MKLGQERAFHDLITGTIDPEIRQRLMRNRPMSAVDIGCGNGLTLLFLYYALGIEQLEGVEIFSASEALKPCNDDQSAHGRPAFQAIEDLWLSVTTDQLDVRPQITDASQFKELLNISYSTGIGVHEFMRKHYDIILLSNVAHYMDSGTLKYTFKVIEQLMDSNSLVYIRIKDDFKDKKMSSEELHTACSNFAQQAGLTEFKGGRSDEGNAYTFTNI